MSELVKEVYDLRDLVHELNKKNADLLAACKGVLQYQKCDADCGCNWLELREAIERAEK